MWHAFGGSVPGRSHLATDSACQDYSSWHTDDGALCIAVADGAGSRTFSAEGAKAAVEAVLAWSRSRMLAGRLTRPLEEAFHVARARVVERAAELEIDPEDLATTLGVAVADGTSVRFGQLGDGIGVVALEGGTIEAVTPHQRSEYVNETAFITDSGWESDLRLARFPLAAVSGLSLSTDGLQFKILANVPLGIPYLPFFRDLFGWAATLHPVSGNGSHNGAGESLQQYLEQLDDDQSDDDRTLVVAVRAGAELESAPPPRFVTREEWLAQRRNEAVRRMSGP